MAIGNYIFNMTSNVARMDSKKGKGSKNLMTYLN